MPPVGGQATAEFSAMPPDELERLLFIRGMTAEQAEAKNRALGLPSRTRISKGSPLLKDHDCNLVSAE